MKSYKINVLATALTPITHMMGTKGNEALINREAVMVGGKVVNVPFISGNAIRHKMIREPGTIDLIKQCDLEGKLSIEQFAFMSNGGSLTESSTNTNIAKIYNMQQLLPLFRLLGGSLKNQIISGSLNNSFGFLVCKENKERLTKILNNDCLSDFELKSYEHFIDKFQYTRSSIKNVKNYERFMKENEPNNENLMIYNGQTLIAGSKFIIQFVLLNCDDIELGALLNAISCYIDSGCNIGGMGRIGHGRIDIEFIDNEYEYEALIDNYRKHNEINSIAIYNWLNETFPSVAIEKSKKSKDKKGSKNDKELEIVDLFDN